MSFQINEAVSTATFLISTDINNAASSMQTFEEEQPLTIKITDAGHRRIPSRLVDIKDVYRPGQQTLRVNSNGKTRIVAQLSPTNGQITKKRIQKPENPKGYLHCLLDRIKDLVNLILSAISNLHQRIIPWTASQKGESLK